ncbi:exo-beta-1,3-glucanase, partial [Luminiphilus sp.]|nr:exo-beta-1,3-glucanase [Luminiphilus sp.]
MRQRLLLILTAVLISFTQWGCSPEQKMQSSPAAADIFGDPQYHAVSFGGYRGLSRDDGPTVEQLMDDVRILDAMGVKLLRTYNTSQFPQVERLLAAI